MNKKTFFERLNAELAGKKFDGRAYDIEIDIQHLARDILREEKINESFIFNVSCDKYTYSNNEFKLTYKNHYVCGIRVKKTKGTTHFGIFSNRVDWFYKSFESIDDESYDFDFMKKVVEIETEIIDTANAKEKTKQEMYGYYKQVKELLGEKTRAFLDYFYNHRWDMYSMENNDKGDK